MEYVPGDHLKNIIRKRGRLSVDDTLSLAVQACAGIGYAHRAGLVHCDIKPHNMLVTPDMRLKVADFGIARALASILPEEKADVVWGSPQYFSPEQATGAPPSPASDVYSLGVVMYEMLTSQLPFAATSAEELARLHRDLPPPSPSQINHAVSPALEQVLIKVLSKEPANRYRTADQLGRVLMTLIPNSNSTAASFIKEYPLAAEPEKPVGPVATSTAVSRRQTNAYPPAPQAKPVYPPPKGVSVSRQPVKENPLEIDWITIGLGLLALITVGGLIPFYLWIFFLYR